MFLFQRKDSKNKAHLQSPVGDYPKSLHSLNMKSEGFVSLVLCHFRHRSVGFVSPVRSLSGTGDARMHRMPKTVAGPGQKCGPGTQNGRTGDTNPTDLGRNVPGPATEGQQDEGRHGDRTKAGTEPARNR